MSDFITNLYFALSVTGPIILFLLLGVALKHWHIITEEFIDVGSRLVFNVTLPALLFITISQTHFAQAANFMLVAIGLIGTMVLFWIIEIIAKYTVQPARDRGVVVQGGYRSNMGIIGLAYVVNAYGSEGLAQASLYLGLVTILFNILAVITLNRSINRELPWSQILKKIAGNPLIIGILSALPFAYFNIQIPGLFLDTGKYFAQMTLPLALLCTGGSLSLSVLRLESRNALIGTGCKILIAPLILTLTAGLAGFNGIQLGIVFLMSSAPTAAASYVMARAMGGNSSLAANIIVLTTIGSVIVTTLGITWLRLFGLV
jgi:malonate transporter and related proteins